MQRMVDQIKSQQWFFGIRAEASLFMYSAKYWNREELHKKEYKSDFVETLLFPKSSDYPVRVFNLEQAKKFHNESKTKVLNNPEILRENIQREAEIWDQIESLYNDFQKVEDFEYKTKIFKKLLELYGEVGNFFFINFSLGRELTANQHMAKQKVSDIISKHNQWRNSITFKEEKLGEVLSEFIRVLIREKNIDLDPLEATKYLSAQEIIAYIEEEISFEEIKNSIIKRKSEGYLFTYLKDPEFRRVIDDVNIIKDISDHLLMIDDIGELKLKELKGQTAYNTSAKIKGEIIIVKDKNELEKINSENLKDKILVAVQTTPHFIPYLKGVKAIITDEGGITCHAAIISRELKIPCIVGTKIATQVLKDGDLVEIDTKEGIFNKISS